MTLVLDSTSKSIEAVLLAAPATQPDFIATWADGTSSVFTEGSSDGVLNGTTPVTIVAAPASGTRRVIKTIRIFNRNASAVTLRLSYKNGSDLRRIVETTIASGLSYIYPEISASAIVFREVLTGNRTYYVRTDGNDANTGLVDNPGGAFLTPGKFIDTLATLDTNGFTVTCQLGDGTYTITTDLNTKPITGGGSCVIQGNASNPANVILNGTTASRTLRIRHPDYTIQNFRLQGGTVFALQIEQYTVIGPMHWGANSVSGVIAVSGNGYLSSHLSNWTISGNSPRFLWILLGGQAYLGSATFTLTGTPNYSGEFVLSDSNANVWFDGITFSGSATGIRYTARRGGGIITTNALPGTGGSATAPGYYVGP